MGAVISGDDLFAGVFGFGGIRGVEYLVRTGLEFFLFSVSSEMEVLEEEASESCQASAESSVFIELILMVSGYAWVTV